MSIKNIYVIKAQVSFLIRKDVHLATETFCSRYNDIKLIEAKEFNFHNLITKKYKQELKIEKILSEQIVGTWIDKPNRPA